MEHYLEYTLTPKGGEMFVNHEKNHRSGHVMAFYSNCSGKRNKWAPGHNGFGWLEYKRSGDGGVTWDEGTTLPYSYYALINEPFTISCEKAVSTQENEIVALCIRNENVNGWEPYLEPIVIKSNDGGETWSEPKLICDKKGRIYDALVKDGVIYLLLLANDDFLAVNPEHRYYIYESSDHGETFKLRSELPGETFHHAYGNMAIRDDGSLICYQYNQDDEFNMFYCISPDMGLTWTETGNSYCKKRIRNPQVAKLKNGYILHGRSGCNQKEPYRDYPMDFVLYTSLDGIHWDDGEYIYSDEHGQTAYYSNNIVLEDSDGNQRVLIQSSVPYSKGCVNILHWFLDIK